MVNHVDVYVRTYTMEYCWYPNCGTVTWPAAAWRPTHRLLSPLGILPPSFYCAFTPARKNWGRVSQHYYSKFFTFL